MENVPVLLSGIAILERLVFCEVNLFMQNRSTNVHNMGTWHFFLTVEVSFLHVLYEFHEIKLSVMKYTLNCVSRNSLKEMFHSVSSPLLNAPFTFITFIHFV